MKILFLNPSSRLGGAERSLIDVATSLRKSCPECALQAILPADGQLAVSLAAIGVRVTVLPFPASLAQAGESAFSGGVWARRVRVAFRAVAAVPASCRYVIALRREVKRIGPSIVHSNGLKMHVLGALALPRPALLVWHVRDYLTDRPITPLLLRLVSSRCALIIANSQSVAADIRHHMRDSVRVVVIYNGIDLIEFSPNGPAVLPGAAGSVKENAFHVALIATFANWKGHMTFLKAIRIMSTRMPVSAFIVGGPIYDPTGSQVTLDQLRRTAEQYGIAESVCFTGNVEHTAPIMRAMDVVVHASTKPEPFGRVVAEAMGCARATVVSRAGGACEVMEEGVTSLGHEPGNQEQLATALETLAGNRALRDEMGKAGRERAERLFGRDLIATQLLPEYEGLMLGREVTEC